MYILKKDIVIKAGTVFDTAPIKTERPGDGHIETIIGLTKNSYGALCYSFDNLEEVQEWFEEK